MPEQDQVTLVCVNVEHKPHSSRGSIEIKCDKCNAAVWLSVQGQAYVKEHPNTKIEISCINCALDTMRERNAEFGGIVAEPHALYAE